MDNICRDKSTKGNDENHPDQQERHDRGEHAPHPGRDPVTSQLSTAVDLGESASVRIASGQEEDRHYLDDPRDPARVRHPLERVEELDLARRGEPDRGCEPVAKHHGENGQSAPEVNDTVAGGRRGCGQFLGVGQILLHMHNVRLHLAEHMGVRPPIDLGDGAACDPPG